MSVSFKTVFERNFWAAMRLRKGSSMGADEALEDFRARNVAILERGTRPTSRDEVAQAIVVALAKSDVAISTELGTKVAEAIFVVFREDRVSA